MKFCCMSNPTWCHWWEWTLGMDSISHWSCFGEDDLYIYINVYLIITHDEDMHRQGTTSNQKTDPCQQVNWKAVSQVFLQFCGIAWIGNRLWKAKSMLSLGIDFHRATQAAEAFMATQDTHWIRFRIWKATGPSNSCAQLGFSIELIQPGCRGFSDKKEDKHNWSDLVFSHPNQQVQIQNGKFVVAQVKLTSLLEGVSLANTRRHPAHHWIQTGIGPMCSCSFDGPGMPLRLGNCRFHSPRNKLSWVGRCNDEQGLGPDWSHPISVGEQTMTTDVMRSSKDLSNMYIFFE